MKTSASSSPSSLAVRMAVAVCRRVVFVSIRSNKDGWIFEMMISWFINCQKR